MLTTEQLRSIMPQLPAAKSETLFPFLTAAIAEFGVDRPARTAAFLAQLAHESAQLRFMEEIWGPTAAQRRYEPPSPLATKLGNTDAGDGFRFKGRGPIQITGRANYRRFGDLLTLDLVAEPTRAALPEIAFRIAGLYWSKKGLNELADQVTPEAFREITRRINGGFNGLEDRERFYEVAKTALGVTAPAEGPVSFDVEFGEEEPVFERGLEDLRAVPTSAAGRKAGARKADRPRRTVKKRNAKAPVATKVAARTPAAKKSAGKKPAVRKAAAKKAVKKVVVKKAAPKRRTAKTRPQAAKKASPRKSPAGSARSRPGRSRRSHRRDRKG